MASRRSEPNSRIKPSQRFGDAVGREHEQIASLQQIERPARRSAIPENEPSGMPGNSICAAGSPRRLRMG